MRALLLEGIVESGLIVAGIFVGLRGYNSITSVQKESRTQQVSAREEEYEGFMKIVWGTLLVTGAGGVYTLRRNMEHQKFLNDNPDLYQT